MRRRIGALVWLGLLLPLLLLAACDLFPEDATPVVTTIATSPAATIPEPTPELSLTPIVVDTPAPEQHSITLTLWTRPDVVPSSEEPGSTALLEQLTAFDAQHPELTLLVEAKTSSGQGGSLSYLRSGRSVAPAILPDLVLLPASQLTEAVAESLVYPLDGALSEEMVGALYPAGRALGQVDGVTYGYPYALINVQHLIYDTAVITTSLPTTWPELFAAEDETRLIFPAASQDGARLTLQLYLAAGGTLRTDTGQLALQAEPLTVALSQLEQAVTTGRILPESAATTSLDQTWQIFQNSTANIVLSDAMTYQRLDLPAGRYAFAALPGLEASLPPRAGALLWVVTTPDPVRQALALELITWLCAPPNLAAWSYAANFVPARTDALSLWPGGDAHAAFLSRMLPEARPYPAEASAALLAALMEATENVMTGVQSATDAANAAVTSLTP